MSILVVVTVCLAALPSVLGHAALVSPTPFNTNPSKSFTTGGVSAGPLNIIPDGPRTLSWRLIAGDGAGAIKMLVDPAGLTTNFPTSNGATPAASLIQVPLTGADPTVVGVTYDYTYQWPAGLTCTGANGMCTAQVSSTSNWVAGFSFSKTAPAAVSSTAGTSAAQVFSGGCVTAANLVNCPMVNGKTIWVPTGADALDMDLTVAATMEQNLNNSRVFSNQPQSAGVSTTCTRAYQRYLCGDAFMLCNAAGTQPIDTVTLRQPCLQSCTEFTCWCDLNPIHADLYRCNLQNAARDATGSCSTAKFGPNNATCVPRPATSTAGSCIGDSCAAFSSASFQPLVMAALAVAAAFAVFYN